MFIDHCLNLPLYPAAPLVHGRPLAQSHQAAPVKGNHRHLHIGGSESYNFLDLFLISHNSFHAGDILHACVIADFGRLHCESRTMEKVLFCVIADIQQVECVYGAWWKL